MDPARRRVLAFPEALRAYRVDSADLFTRRMIGHRMKHGPTSETGEALDAPR